MLTTNIPELSKVIFYPVIIIPVLMAKTAVLGLYHDNFKTFKKILLIVKFG